jgi:hypothetical protein
MPNSNCTELTTMMLSLLLRWYYTIGNALLPPGVLLPPQYPLQGTSSGVHITRYPSIHKREPHVNDKGNSNNNNPSHNHNSHEQDSPPYNNGITHNQEECPLSQQATAHSTKPSLPTEREPYQEPKSRHIHQPSIPFWWLYHPDRLRFRVGWLYHPDRRRFRVPPRATQSEHNHNDAQGTARNTSPPHPPNGALTKDNVPTLPKRHGRTWRKGQPFNSHHHSNRPHDTNSQVRYFSQG